MFNQFTPIRAFDRHNQSYDHLVKPEEGKEESKEQNSIEEEKEEHKIEDLECKRSTTTELINFV
jgi:hypothetical protein